MYRPCWFKFCNHVIFSPFLFFLNAFSEYCITDLLSSWKSQPCVFRWQPPILDGAHFPPRRALPLPKCYSLSVTVELRCQQHAVGFLPGALDFASGKRDGPVGLHAELNPVVFLIVILRLGACVPLQRIWYLAWSPISKRPLSSKYETFTVWVITFVSINSPLYTQADLFFRKGAFPKSIEMVSHVVSAPQWTFRCFIKWDFTD